jgi:hypothetical protein
MKKIINSCLVFSLFFFFASCDEGGEPDQEKTNVADYAGEWYVDAIDEAGVAVFAHEVHQTFNTSANDNTMWLDDKEHGEKVFKCKVTIDQNGNFSASNAANMYDLDENGVPKSTVTITEGRIIKGGGKSQSGKTVDKITFKANFSYDLATVITSYDGHKRTGFKEDEY